MVIIRNWWCSNLKAEPELDVNGEDAEGRRTIRQVFFTKSYYMLRHYYIFVLRLLALGRDVDVNLADMNNETPLFAAVKRGRENIVG